MKLAKSEQEWADGVISEITQEGGVAYPVKDGMVEIADGEWITEQRAEEIIQWVA